MAVPGRKPTENPRHRNKPTADWTIVEDVPYAGDVPELPKTRTVLTREGKLEVELLEMTKLWWATISRMPHCKLWTASDWMFALSTALTADQAYSGVASSQTELRNREKVLGTTVEFRRDLRIRYVTSGADPVLSEGTNSVARIEDYRDL